MKRLVLIILLAPVLLFLLVFLVHLAEQRAKAARAVNPRAAEAMAEPLLNYASEHNGRLPDAMNWFEIAGTNGNITTRQLPRKPFVVMAMNQGLSGVRLSDLHFPSQTVLLFECTAYGPDAGGIELLPAVPANSRGYMIVFADGHLEVVRAAKSLHWQPIVPEAEPSPERSSAEQEEIEAARARDFWQARPKANQADRGK